MSAVAPAIRDLVCRRANHGDAHRFYQRLGFAASHEGFKLALENRA